MQNPDWSLDEHILAFDVYIRFPDARNNDKHAAVLELSHLLQALPIHPLETRNDKFRNPSGVGMKLRNFIHSDPTNSEGGLKQGSKIERQVWNEFSKDHEKLLRVANAIKEGAHAINSGILTQINSDDQLAVSEGTILATVHKHRERDTKIVKRKKAKVLAETGRLACEACGFDFAETYGEIGIGFAECHHDRPISQMSPGEKTALKDLRIVCANCHHMIHRMKPWKPMDEIAKLFEVSKAF